MTAIKLIAIWRSNGFSFWWPCSHFSHSLSWILFLKKNPIGPPFCSTWLLVNTWGIFFDVLSDSKGFSKGFSHLKENICHSSPPPLFFTSGSAWIPSVFWRVFLFFISYFSCYLLFIQAAISYILLRAWYTPWNSKRLSKGFFLGLVIFFFLQNSFDLSFDFFLKRFRVGDTPSSSECFFEGFFLSPFFSRFLSFLFSVFIIFLEREREREIGRAERATA